MRVLALEALNSQCSPSSMWKFKGLHWKYAEGWTEGRKGHTGNAFFCFLPGSLKINLSERKKVYTTVKTISWIHTKESSPWLVEDLHFHSFWLFPQFIPELQHFHSASDLWQFSCTGKEWINNWWICKPWLWRWEWTQNAGISGLHVLHRRLHSPPWLFLASCQSGYVPCNSHSKKLIFKKFFLRKNKTSKQKNPNKKTHVQKLKLLIPLWYQSVML